MLLYGEKMFVDYKGRTERWYRKYCDTGGPRSDTVVTGSASPFLSGLDRSSLSSHSPYE